jgi:hypothetical protein
MGCIVFTALSGAFLRETDSSLLLCAAVNCDHCPVSGRSLALGQVSDLCIISSGINILKKANNILIFLGEQFDLINLLMVLGSWRPVGLTVMLVC